MCDASHNGVREEEERREWMPFSDTHINIASIEGTFHINDQFFTQKKFYNDGIVKWKEEEEGTIARMRKTDSCFVRD